MVQTLDTSANILRGLHTQKCAYNVTTEITLIIQQ